MSVSNYNDLRQHIGHKLECVKYGECNVSIECITCGEVIFDFDSEEDN